MQSVPKRASQTEAMEQRATTLIVALAFALAVVYGVIADPVTPRQSGGYDAIPVRAPFEMAHRNPPKHQRPPHGSDGDGQATLTRIVP